MAILGKAIGRCRRYIWTKRRKRICRREARRLISPEISILSMNCTGGVLYHDLGLQFQSPTINLYFPAEDFIRFCERLEDYLAIETMTECRDSAIIEDRAYPVARLGDIRLYLVHYSSVAEAQEAWNRRKKRLKRENIVVFATDRDGMTDALKDRFEKLPFHKVMFTHRPDADHPSCFYLKGYEREKAVGLITEPVGWRGRRPVDQFDYVRFFNQAAQKA